MVIHTIILLFAEQPSHWDPMPTDPQTGKEVALHCADLTLGSPEYIEVLKEFNKTMVPTAVGGLQPSNTYKKIVRIQRIQNPGLYTQYLAKKKDMEKHNPPGHQNEWRLFHGTPPDVCPKINQQGFNRSFAGKNGELVKCVGKMGMYCNCWQPVYLCHS